MGVGVLHQLRRNGTLGHVGHTSRRVLLAPSSVVCPERETIETGTEAAQYDTKLKRPPGNSPANAQVSRRTRLELQDNNHHRQGSITVSERV